MVSINDDDLPADVDAEFGQSSYTVAEGGTVTVKVTLSEDPERDGGPVPIAKAGQGGASSSDYSGVPASVVLQQRRIPRSPSPSRQRPTAVDDDGESR